MSKRSKRCCTPEPIEQCNKNILLITIIAFALYYMMFNNFNNVMANQNRYLVDNTVNQNNNLINNMMCNSRNYDY